MGMRSSQRHCVQQNIKGASGFAALTIASVLLFFSALVREGTSLGEAVWDKWRAKPLALVQVSNQNCGEMGLQGKVGSSFS